MRVLGKVGLANRGTYSASTTYTALDFVLYNGSTFVALKEVTGVTPVNDGVNWQYMALGTAVSLHNDLTTETPGEFAMDAAQGPVITNLIDQRAPESHADTTTKYGQGNANNYGHVKLLDTYTTSVSGANAAGGVGASQNALYNAYANRAPINHATTATTYGIGTASNYGHVKLSDTYASKVTNGAAANGLAASQNALYNVYNTLKTRVDKSKIVHSGAITHENVNVANNTNVALASISLSASTNNLIIFTVSWQSNATGNRSIWVSSTATGEAIQVSYKVIAAAASGANTQMQLAICRYSSAAETLYLVGKQNSGSTLAISIRDAHITLPV